MLAELKTMGRMGVVSLVFCAMPWLSVDLARAQQGLVTEHAAGGASESSTVANGAATFQPVRTDSPRETLNSFVRLTWVLESAVLRYQAEQNRANFERIAILGPRFAELLDLSQVSKASRREVGENTIAYLLCIIGRLGLPPLEEVPDETTFDDEQAPAKWRIPGTPIRIVQVKGGPSGRRVPFQRQSGGARALFLSTYPAPAPALDARNRKLE